MKLLPKINSTTFETPRPGAGQNGPIKWLKITGTIAGFKEMPNRLNPQKTDVSFEGEFEAVDLRTGESGASGKMYLPAGPSAYLKAQAYPCVINLEMTLVGDKDGSKASVRGYTWEVDFITVGDKIMGGKLQKTSAATTADAGGATISGADAPASNVESIDTAKNRHQEKAPPSPEPSIARKGA